MEYQEKFIKHELKERGDLLTKPALRTVFALYPQFQEDYKILKQYGYITETETGLEWKNSKQSLAEYFGYLPIPRNLKYRPWKDIEILFGKTGLKNSFSKNGSSYKKKSKGYEELSKILSHLDSLPLFVKYLIQAY
jgi:hypothetical protein